MFKFSSDLRFEFVQLLFLQLDAVVAALDALVEGDLELGDVAGKLRVPRVVRSAALRWLRAVLRYVFLRVFLTPLLANNRNTAQAT